MSTSVSCDETRQVCSLDPPDGFIDQWAVDANANPEYQGAECPVSIITGKPEKIQVKILFSCFFFGNYLYLTISTTWLWQIIELLNRDSFALSSLNLFNTDGALYRHLVSAFIVFSEMCTRARRRFLATLRRVCWYQRRLLDSGNHSTHFSPRFCI